MLKNSIVYFSIFIISATVVSFEIVATRISSVIFVNNYAFIILSLAILGLGAGGIYSHYFLKSNEINESSKVIFRIIILIGISSFFFISATILLTITNHFIYFFLLFLPFFFAGIVYSQLFKFLAEKSFLLYASDLAGAALGSIASVYLLNFLGAPNSVLFLSVLIFCSAIIFLQGRIKKVRQIGSFSILVLFAVILIMNGDGNLLGRIPIGNFPEKDFYYVYPNAVSISQIIESRWSIHGRSDLVQYNNQDMVKQLFIDGAAGTQMYRFDGDTRNPDRLLYNLLILQTSTIPFLFLTEPDKNNMLVIGPGGGKEILTGLIGGVEQITGVEINPDFVSIVKKYRDFNGGIYTDFPNVKIVVGEGRHYIKKADQYFDLIVMALPSTEQLQSIDNFAMNENYLLTTEAIQDYLKILTPEGRLIFTVHNNWELMRLIITSMFAFNKTGINNQEFLNHILILEKDYAPTIVIKKSSFTQNEIAYTENVIGTLPKELPAVTYLPYHWGELKYSLINNFLNEIRNNRTPVQEYIQKDKYNISPCTDDSPYFYKIKKGVPVDYMWLLTGVFIFNLLIIGIPLILIKKKPSTNKVSAVILPMVIFLFIGAGFMIIEISLFQKLILFLGSPTISLSVLLCSLLIGMGLGSFFGGKMFKSDLVKRLTITFITIVIAGILLFIIYPFILNQLLGYSLFICSSVCFVMILPLGFSLGLPFPTAIQYLKQKKMEDYIPWMYGINGSMSVLGSVIAINFSMIWGFTLTFFIGISIYFLLFLIMLFKIGLKIINPVN